MCIETSNQIDGNPKVTKMVEDTRKWMNTILGW